MSSQWRHISEGQWEMTQSNPPSELPNDPITSTSSNPDEHSSSPVTDERTQDFSYAAQMETEPIPLDNVFDDGEDMLVGSSSRQSVDGTNTGMESDPNDPDFKASESENDGDDVTYKSAKTQQRGKKKAAGKNAPKKAAENPRATAKTVSQTTSVMPRSSRRATTKGDNKVVPDSQSPGHERQTKPRQSKSRVPKKSFYSELQNGPSTHVAQQSSNNAKPQSGTSAKKNSKKTSGSRGRVRPASPVETFDYNNDDDDLWYPPDSPGKQDHGPQPEVNVARQLSNDTLDTAIGPNSKKKREKSPEQEGAKPRNTKRTAARYSKQNRPKNLPRNVPEKTNKGKSTLSSESVPRYVQPRVEEEEEEEGESAKQGSVYIDLLETSVSESAVSEEDPQEREVTIPMSPPKVSKPSVQKVSKDRSPLVDEARGGKGKPSQSHKRIDVSKEVLEDTSIQSHANGRQRHSAENLPNREEDIKNVKGKAKGSTVEQLHPSSSSQNVSPNRLHAHTSNSQKSRDGSKINTNQPQGDPVMVQEQMSTSKAGSTQQHHVSPERFSRRSMVSDSGSPLEPPGIPTGNTIAGGRNPHQEQYTRAEKHQGSFPHNPLQASCDMDTNLPSTVISPSTDSEQPHAHGTTKPSVLKSPENRKPIPNRPSRVMMSSSTNDDLVGHANDFVFQAPQLHPRSVDFARKVVQEHNKVGHDDINGREQAERREHNLNNIPLRPQPKGAMKHRNDPIPASSRDAEGMDFSGGHSSRSGHGRFDNPNSGPAYEAKWEDAVNAASGGVVDALHMISTSLLEHLRTREQSVFAVVHEYKRNGTKVSKNLVMRQTEELLDASKTTKQKCSELVKFYGELSEKTQAFRVKCLSKQRNQAYAEWQRQTTRVKGAIRAAREAEILG